MVDREQNVGSVGSTVYSAAWLAVALARNAAIIEMKVRIRRMVRSL
jgi:hypothetical protein